MANRANVCGSAQRWLAAAFTLCVVLLSGSTATCKEDARTFSDQLLGYAAEAAEDGNSARQFALLREASRVAPEDNRPRWQLGQVEVDGEWLAVEEAQRRAAANPVQDDYRRLRDEHGDSPEGQLALARWCRSNRLDDESRVHWSNVLAVDPNHREALRVLKLHWHDGKLMERDDIKQARKEAVGERSTNRHWAVIVAQWDRALAKKSGDQRAAVLDEIRAVRDVKSISAFERLTLDGNATRNARERNRSELARAFIDALAAMPERKATESLVRHGVLSPSSNVRDAAAESLHDRPPHDFVPLLLEGLAAPIELKYGREVDADGSVHYFHEMYREGPFADMSHRVSRKIHQPMSQGSILAAAANGQVEITPSAIPVRAATVSAAAAGRSAARYEEEIAAAEEEIASTNAATQARNERIYAVLRRATDESFADEPRPWWDWWQDYTEYYREPEREVLATYDITNEYVALPSQQKECFAAGTPVWTKTGQQAIETLEIGDLVLAQNVETGELDYRPVIARTVRPPSEVMNVSIGRETIRTTRGHLWWVPGAGWRMTKELKADAPLHGLPGTVRLRNVESAGQAEAYNLVVADFNTYFVGDGGWLVHDNTPRKPTRVALPGIATK